MTRLIIVLLLLYYFKNGDHPRRSFKTVTSYEDSGDAGIVILISVSAGLKGMNGLNSAQLLLFHFVFIYKIGCKKGLSGPLPITDHCHKSCHLAASSDTFSICMYC